MKSLGAGVTVVVNHLAQGLETENGFFEEQKVLRTAEPSLHLPSHVLVLYNEQGGTFAAASCRNTVISTLLILHMII